MDKIITKGTEKLIKGVDLVADIVKSTLGPQGRNVVFSDMYGFPTITNDGVSIAKEVMSDDETEQLGIDIVKQSSFKTNYQAGDGTTTSIVLAQAIIHEGLKSKKHPLDIRNEINEQSSQVIETLKNQAKSIKTFEEIQNVARISAESEYIGGLIAEATMAVGKDGQVNVLESEVNGVRVEYTNGLQIDEGYVADFMQNNEKGEAVLHNPHILVVDSKLANIKDILPMLDKLKDEGIMELLLVCDGVEGNMLPTIAKSKHLKYMQGKNAMDVTVVKFPAISKKEIIEDIGLFTGASVFGMSTGLFPDKGEMKDFGRCEKVIITNKKTTFINGQGDTTEKIEALKTQRDVVEYDKEKFDTRIARLTGKVAVIRVGAPTEAELRYIKLKIDDAVCATKAAIEEGVVRGGGMALKMIALDLPDGVLKNALQYPYNQIQENAGRKLKIEDNIFDPVKVTRCALENAVSCAGALLTISSSIATKKIRPRE